MVRSNGGRTKAEEITGKTGRAPARSGPLPGQLARGGQAKCRPFMFAGKNERQADFPLAAIKGRQAMI